MATPHDTVARANEKPLSPFESAAKPPESLNFATIMANEVHKGQCSLLNSTPMEMSSSKGGSEQLDLSKWNPAMECGSQKMADATQQPVANRNLDFDSAPKLSEATQSGHQDLFAQADAATFRWV